MNKKLISFKELSEKLSSKELRNVTGGSYAGGGSCMEYECSYDTICFSGGVNVGWCRWIEYIKQSDGSYYGGGACQCIPGAF